MKYGTTRGTRGRRAYRLKGRPPSWAQPERYPVTVRHVEPEPRTPPEQAARIRASLSQLGLSGWDLERIDRQYVGDVRRAPPA